MKKRDPFTPDEIKQLVGMVNSGILQKDIAKHFGLHPKAMQKRVLALRRDGLLPPPRGNAMRKKVAGEWAKIKPELLRLIEVEGMTKTAACAAVGLSFETVRKRLKRDGVTVQTRQGPPRKTAHGHRKSRAAHRNPNAGMGAFVGPKPTDISYAHIPHVVRELQRFGPCFRADIYSSNFAKQSPSAYFFCGKVYPIEALASVLERCRAAESKKHGDKTTTAAMIAA